MATMGDRSTANASTETPSAPPQNASKKKTQPFKTAAVTPDRQLKSSSHARPSTAAAANTANSSTPRTHPRPATARSLSTPLARSLSFRGPRVKERRCLSTNGQSPITTYQDDFQSPEDLSHKLRGLNLETSCAILSVDCTDLNHCTTYRESFRWRKSSKGSPRPTPASPCSDSGSDKNGELTGPVDTHTLRQSTNEPNMVRTTDASSRNKSISVSKAKEAAGATPSRGQYNSNSRGSDLFSVLKHRDSAAPQTQRNANSVTQVLENGTASLPNKEPKSAITRMSGSIKQETPAPVRTNGNASLRAPASHVTQMPAQTNGNVSVSAGVSPGIAARQARAAQLQSSVGNSPFAYGSDSGSWV